MAEQIFISYRREGGDVTAKLICEALKLKGYTVFYDFDSLHGGHFDERILDAIEGCDDFILVLPQTRSTAVRMRTTGCGRRSATR